MAYIIGPDVSFYQDDPETPQGIDFAKMKETAKFVIIRAGQNKWPDSDFKFNWKEARKVGLPRGSYWFYDSREDPKRQAELWVEQFEGDFGELPLFADFEESYNGPYQGWRKWYDFLERLKTLVGSKEICIYTAYYYWRDNAPNATLQPGNLEYFHQYPLWIANYGAAKPSVPLPWKSDEWLFWQYSETGDGKLYGVESNAIDLNYFNGDLPAFKVRFNLPDAPPPPPPPPPPPVPGTGRRYGVTVTSLRMREGPGTTYNIVGYLTKTDTVEEISANVDRSWLRVRRESDNLIGWSSSQYLVSLDSPPPPPPPPPVPIDVTWYKFTSTALTLRDGPSTSAKQIGYLYTGDVVPAISTSTDGNWVQIQRVDGLTGWCNKTYLTLLGKTQPALVQQKLFASTLYFRKELSSPRKMVAHVLAINLRVGELVFLVTPTNNSDGTICPRTTSGFLQEFSLHMAINGDGFSFLTNPTANCPGGNEPVMVNGFAASRGKVYSDRPGPTVYISARNEVTFNSHKGLPYNAVSGDRLVVAKGAKVPNLPTDLVEPRTAIGSTSNGRGLIFIVVDGRQPGYSEGASYSELADLLLSFGAYSGINMDGGGSSAMAVKGSDGKPKVLNTPIDRNTPGTERLVANHLGIFIKK